MTCHWCGDEHGVDQLCQRAQHGLTRRSFCFLFGAGIAGLTLGTADDSWTEVAQLSDLPWLDSRVRVTRSCLNVMEFQFEDGTFGQMSCVQSLEPGDYVSVGTVLEAPRNARVLSITSYPNDDGWL